MSQMGRYCKAYFVLSLRQFAGWKEKTETLRQPKDDKTGVAVRRTSLNDDDVVYLQENYIVTDDIFIDENRIFDEVTNDWKVFCDETLGFRVPEPGATVPPSAGQSGKSFTGANSSELVIHNSTEVNVA